MSLEDESLVKRLQEIRIEYLETLEPYKVSKPEELFIKAGLKDIEEGRTYSHEEIMQEVRERYKL